MRQLNETFYCTVGFNIFGDGKSHTPDPETLASTQWIGMLLQNPDILMVHGSQAPSSIYDLYKDLVANGTDYDKITY